VISWLQFFKELTELEKEQKTKKTGFGTGGGNTAALSAMNKKASSPTYLQNSEQDFSVPLLQLSDDDNFPDLMKNLWAQAQLKRPWQDWVRSLGKMWGTTPPMAMKEEEYTHTFHANFEE
jgi:hypothetical protein